MTRKTFKNKKYYISYTHIAGVYEGQEQEFRRHKFPFCTAHKDSWSWSCQLHEDTITNLTICQELRAVPRSGAVYEDIFSSSVDIQKTAVLQFRALLQARDRILKWEEETEQSA